MPLSESEEKMLRDMEIMLRSGGPTLAERLPACSESPAVHGGDE